MDGSTVNTYTHTISPKLFIATLESLFRKIDWEENEINGDRKNLNNLRFADHISTTTENNTADFQQILSDLNRKIMKIGLKMNKTKTKVMLNDKVTPNDIRIDGKTLEEVEEYIYRTANNTKKIMTVK